MYEYDEYVSLILLVIEGGGSYNFTWEAPVGSSSLERGTIYSDGSFSELIFEAHEEDSGIYICRIDSTGKSFAARVTVGNTHLQSI